MKPREITARYPGVCKQCGRKIKEGQKIWWAPDYVYHAEHFPFGQGKGPGDWPEDPDPDGERKEWQREMTELAWELATADGSLGRADVGTEGEGPDPSE